MSQNEWPRALEKAQAAYLLARAEPAPCRAMARVLTHSTNAAALQFWQQLIREGQATEAERRDFIELAIRAGALGVASDQVQKLLTEAPNQAQNAWLASQLFAASGDYSQTLSFAARARSLDPANQRYQLFLSSLLFDSEDAQRRLEARSNLWAVASGTNQFSLDALAFLAHRADLSLEQTRAIRSLLEENPRSAMPQKLLALDLSLRLEPELRAQLLSHAAAQYQGAKPAVLGQFVVWLNQHEEYQRALEAVPLNTALKRKEVFLPFLDAQAALGRWDEVEKELVGAGVPLEGAYTEAFLARCATQTSKTQTAALHWKKALFYAEAKPEQLSWLAVFAEKCGEAQTAKQAYRALLPYAADARQVYQALEQLTMATSTTAELRDLIGEMLKRWPKDGALRNDFAYLGLLLERDLGQARQTAEELVKQSPESLPFRTTLALAWYRQKDYPAALKVYEGRQYDWSQALAGNRAVYSAVLAANGKPDEALEQARAIPRERLREEERELIGAH